MFLKFNVNTLGLICNFFLITLILQLNINFQLIVFILIILDRSWHASNIFYSFNRALLFVQGCDLVIAICLGDSPVKHLAEMQTLMTVLFVWWLALFSPLDILTKALNFKVGDIKPVALLLVVMTSLRNLVAISDG